VLVLALSGQVELLSSRRDSRKFYYVASLHWGASMRWRPQV
jgi:hypothetical protein